jgi:hypothetical protein
MTTQDEIRAVAEEYAALNLSDDEIQHVASSRRIMGEGGWWDRALRKRLAQVRDDAPVPCDDFGAPYTVAPDYE